MSCVAENRFTSSTAMNSGHMAAGSAASANVASTAATANCSGVMTARRRPNRGARMASTRGAHRNFSAHGSASRPVNPMRGSDVPLSRSSTGSACVKKPYGRPCAR